MKCQIFPDQSWISRLYSKFRNSLTFPWPSISLTLPWPVATIYCHYSTDFSCKIYLCHLCPTHSFLSLNESQHRKSHIKLIGTISNYQLSTGTQMTETGFISNKIQISVISIADLSGNNSLHSCCMPSNTNL